MSLSLDGTTGISASGNITGGNVIASGSLVVGSFAPASVSTAGNVTGGNLVTSGIVSATGNLYGGNLVLSGLETVGSTLSAAGNITGGNILTGGLISATGNITGGNVLGGANVNATTFTGSTVSVTGNITGGNLSVGTGTVTVNNIVNSGANGVGNIGSATTYFNTVFAKATSAVYADLAEMYQATSRLDEGQVVEIGGEAEIQLTTTSHSTAVIGIVSTNPSYLMNSALTGQPHTAAVALTGRVPCYVVGKISKGDRLVSSHMAGIATTLDPALYQPGCIIGKALEDYDSNEIGTIEVAVGRT